MVEIVNNNGVMTIESTFRIDEKLANKIKQVDKKQIKALLKDLHIEHRLEEKEDGILSIAGQNMESARVNIAEAADGMQHAHKEFLKKVGEICELNELGEDTAEEEDFLLYAGMSALSEVLKHIDASCMIIVKRKDNGEA